MHWNRNPEEFDFRFAKSGENVLFEIFQYPTDERESVNREMVFAHEGKIADICQTFAETFNQLYEDRDTDEFEFNWRQPFPFAEYEEFKKKCPTEKRELDDLKIMDNKIRCQSCGMPLSKEFGNLGTNVDGTTTDEYCSFCFSGGNFTKPDQTLEEMITSSIDNMTSRFEYAGRASDESCKFVYSDASTLEIIV